MGKFKIKINEMKESPKEYSTYNFEGTGTYCALWAGNLATYPDTSLQDILDKHGLVNENKSLQEAHVTLVFSPDLIDIAQYTICANYLDRISEDGLEVKVEDIVVFANPDGTHLVAQLELHPDLLKLNSLFKSFGLSETFPVYKPHMTLFTTDEVLDPAYFDSAKPELLSILKSKPINFVRWSISNIAEKYVNKLKPKSSE